MRSVYLIRHGETNANKMELWGLDFSLNELGIAQANSLMFNLRDMGLKFDTVVCSDKRRTIYTAKLIFPERDIIVIDRRFREIYFGSLEGKPIKDEDINKIREQPLAIKTEYGGDDIWKRTDIAIDAIRKHIIKSVPPHGSLAIVGHGTLFQAIIHRIGKDKDIMEKDNGKFVLWSPSRHIKNCEMIRFDAKDFFAKEAEGR